MLEGRYSTIGLWDKCQRQWYYSQIRRLESKVDAQPLRRGTLVHKGFEAALRYIHAVPFQEGWSRDLYAAGIKAIAMDAVSAHYETWLAAMNAMSIEITMEYEPWVAEAAMYTCRALESFGIAHGYWTTLCSPDGEPLIERFIRIDRGEGIVLRGTLDWVGVRNDGTIWVVDFKTHKNLQKYEEDVMNAQTAMYQWLLMEGLGIEVSGTAIFQIKAAVPDLPKLIADKSRVSRARIKTDRTTFERAVMAYGFDVEEYRDYINTLKPWDQAIYTFRPPKVVRAIVADQIAKVEAMNRHIQEDRPYVRSMAPDKCSHCNYNEICYEELTGRPIPAEMLSRFKHNMRTGT